MSERHAIIALDCELWRDKAMQEARNVKRHISHDPVWRNTEHNRERIRLAVQSARTWNHHAMDYRRQSTTPKPPLSATPVFTDR